MRVFFCILLLCLGGCSSTPKKSDYPNPIEAQTVMSEKKESQRDVKSVPSFSHWKAEGRIAASKGKKGGNASYVWQQNESNYHIKLFGPFGSGAMYIKGNHHTVEVKEANGKTSTAQTPEQLLQKIAGLHVPITGLQHWMIAEPSPRSKPSSQKFDKQGRLLFLQQDGWQIQYESYQEGNAELPTRMLLKNNDLVVKMVIKSWKKNIH